MSHDDTLKLPEEVEGGRLLPLLPGQLPSLVSQPEVPAELAVQKYELRWTSEKHVYVNQKLFYFLKL